MFGSVAYISLGILCITFETYSSSEDDFEGRIIDGQFVKIRDYPHAVFIKVIRGDDSVHVCGSSVVNQNFLLTAAHCFSYEEGGKDDKIIAYAGHEDLNKTNIIRKSQSPILHEKFDVEAVKNDIALIYLSRGLPLGKCVKRIIIMSRFPRKTNSVLAGWGIINEITNEETMLLRAVTQTVKNTEVCSRLISGPGNLCAGSLQSSDPRPAEGDSGSGLITKNNELIGVLSYKDRTMPALSVYTNVSYYYNWIRFHITQKCLNN